MKCSKVRDLLLADYMDGQAGEDVRKEVLRHIAACPDCRDFEALAKKAAVEPFGSVKQEAVPAHIFDGIRSRIESRYGLSPALRVKLASVFDGIRDMVMNIPRPVAVLAASAAVLVAIFVSALPPKDEPLNSYISEQMSYISALDSEDASSSGIFDTDIASGSERLI